jgi:uncharacterized damage-inducible protein DinB
VHTAEGLLDLHTRVHWSFAAVIRHAGGFAPEEHDRELAGFGYPSVRLQLHHAIGAEEYWLGVVRGAFRAEDDAHLYPTIDAIEAYRARIEASTAEYLAGASLAELNTPRTMRQWNGRERSLRPAHVVLRTQTHIHHHIGQVAAMVRLLGRPLPAGLDFPLD